MDDKSDPDPSLGDLKSQTSAGKSTSTGYQDDENFSVKLFKYIEFSGKGYDWYYFSEKFEATVEAAGLGELLIYDPSYK